MKNKKFSTCLYSTVGIIVVAVILVIVNLIFKPLNLRKDCTADKLYTLSKGTKNTLKALEEPVSLRFYYSKDVAKMPVYFKNYATRIEDMLREYKQVAGTKLDIKKLNPKPDTDAEDSAKLDGITGKQLDMFGDEQLYLGIAVSCGNRTETLPFLSPEREKLLEYDLTRAILGVKTATKPKIGVMSSLKVMGGFDDPMAMMQGRGQSKPAWIVISELKRTYDVVEINTGVNEIPDDISTLLVIHPKDLSEQTMFALDQYVMRGGKLIAFLDPMSVADMQTQNPQQQQYAPPNVASNLEPLLKAWGIGFDTEQVLLDKRLAGNMGGNGRNPVLVALDKDCIVGEDPTTAQLSSLMMFAAGCFTGTPTEGLAKMVLMKSSDESQLVSKMMLMQGMFDASKLTPDGTTHDFAIKLAGTFKTAFPNGRPEPKAEDGKEAPATQEAPKRGWLIESIEPGVVVLVADADMLFDPICVERQQFLGQVLVQPLNHNLAFAQNLIEYMSGDSALFSIRSRGGTARPFTKVRDMELEANKRFQEKIDKLEKDVQSIQQEINQLQRERKPGDKELLSAEQHDLLKKFRKKEVEAKKELQTVRKELRRDIDSLENNLMLVNIGLMPLLVALSGIAYAIFRRRK